MKKVAGNLEVKHHVTHTPQGSRLLIVGFAVTTG